MKTDFLIIGGGMIGMGIAKALRTKYPTASITLIEKEADVGYHASGRNSGVLHAGFYYSSDSLKARFCRDGNRAMHAWCDEHGLPVNRCQKLVIARDEKDIDGLHELKRRGDTNGVPVELIDEKQAVEIEPNVRTHRMALLSPTTSTVDPAQICHHMRSYLSTQGITFLTNTSYRKRLGKDRILAGDTVFDAGVIVNCAGLYASSIAQEFGFGNDYTILPFKGVYLKYTGTDKPLRTLLYMVPDMRKPFLGVQFDIGVDGSIKIGPTAMPAFWRENYHGLDRFHPGEMLNILRWQAQLFVTNAFGFRTFALEEMRKYCKKNLIDHAFVMAKNLDASKFNEWGPPGIRAQLLNKKTLSLVQDFTIEGDSQSIHILNANSPAFTSSLPFTEWVVETRI